MRLHSFSLRNACKVSSKSSALSSTRKISTSSEAINSLLSLPCRHRRLLFGLRHLRRSQVEVKRGAFVELGFGPDAPTMLVNDALHGGEPYPRTLKILRPVQSLEHSEKLIGILHAEAHPVVA